ncbi:MAG: translocation/assembly module TamB [Dictyoglomus sp.]|nr:translocation/assembly module TamB [Dictyoglomus sp.]MDW8188373.1 translocation/assembly module TamB domain-containing protein [Dictyoglomus sp.]
MDVSEISSLFHANLRDLKGKIYGSIRIKGEIFKNPFFEISITGKDLKYQEFSITRLYILSMGEDLSNLTIRNVTFNIDKNYFNGSGSLNLLRGSGEIKGNIYVSPLNSLFSFSWKGDLREGKGEIIPRDFRQKGKITFNSKGDISGSFSIPIFRGILSLEITGKNWKWKVYGKGENLEKYLKLIEFTVKDDFSFHGNLSLDLDDNMIDLTVSGIYKDGKITGDLEIGDLKGKIIYDFKNLVEIKDIYYSKLRLGEIILDINSQGLDIKGNVLEGELYGRFSSDRVVIDFNEINLKSISEDLRGKVNGEIVFEDFPKFKIVSDEILFKDIKFKRINLTGKVKKGLYFDSFSLFLFDKFEINGNIYVQERNGKFEIKGKILENEFLGEYENGALNLYGDRFILNQPKFIVENWKIYFDDKDFLNLSLRGEIYGILLEIRGILKDEFDFKLSLAPLSNFKLFSPYNYLIKSEWRGNLEFKNNINLTLNLLKTEVPRIMSGKISGNLQDTIWNLSGNFDFIDNGNLKFFLESNGRGKIEGKFLPLDILKDLKIMNISGNILDINLNLEAFSLENGDLYLAFDFPPVKKKLESNLRIIKEDKYKIKGDILKLSKNKGVIDGIFDSKNFEVNIFLPDSEFLYVLTPIENIKNLEKGRININISGSFEKFKGIGKILFSQPVIIPSFLNKIYSMDFILTYEKNKISIESLEIETESSKISGCGEIYPELNLYLNLPRISLNFPYFFQGYSDWEVNIKNIKEPLLEGNVLIYNSMISYSQGEIKELSNLPKIKLSLDVNLGENINFYLPNLLNLSLKGRVKVLGELSKPLLTGKIDFVKGNIQLLNRNFLIDYGYIKFPGLSYEENIWELSGFSFIQNYLVTLKAYGFMGQSSIYLTSSPPLSLKEILFLLLGQERLTLAKEETIPFYSLLEDIPLGIQSFLSGILTEYLLNPLLSEISRILGLESIRIQYTLESFLPTWNKIILEKKLREDIIMRMDYSLEKGLFSNLELEYLLKGGLILKWIYTFEGETLFSFEYKTKF